MRGQETYLHTHTYIYIYIYIYKRNLPIYNEEAQSTSHTSSAQVLELPQSHFGDDWDATFFMITYVTLQNIAYSYIAI